MDLITMGGRATFITAILKILTADFGARSAD